MSERDIAVSPVSLIANMNSSRKPSYLVTLEETLPAGKKTLKYFITLDKPEFLQGFIQVKGFLCGSSEEEISKNYQELLTSVSRDSVVEILFPWHKIKSVRSLVFKAK